jgi:predicted Co/Zn/Cd cation transporter (cation efflux family)
MALSNTAAAITNEIAGNRRYREIRRVTIVGAMINALLSVIKLIFGYLAHSQALIADGLHSLSDLASDFLSIFFCCSRPSMQLAMLMRNILTAMAVSKLCSASCKALSSASSRWGSPTTRVSAYSIQNG